MPVTLLVDLLSANIMHSIIMFLKATPTSDMPYFFEASWPFLLLIAFPLMVLLSSQRFPLFHALSRRLLVLINGFGDAVSGQRCQQFTSSHNGDIKICFIFFHLAGHFLKIRQR